MQLRIIAIGKKMPGWVEEAVNTYRKRLPREFRLTITEIAQSRESDPAIRKRQEGELVMARLKQGKSPTELLVALDVLGESWSTPQLSRNMQQWQLGGQTVTLLIGGPDGLSAECLEKAKLRWSLSALTLPHPLVRVILLEQLYRAHSILSNHPYHRA